MFTPRRKAPWTPEISAPRTESRTSPLRGSTLGHIAASKGKAAAFVDAPPPPPPLGSLAPEGVGRTAGFDSGKFEDWVRFKEAGLLDESTLERKDREALLEKLSRLEKELFDYQYNMGLLLIEKKNLVSRNEELEQEVVEAQQILKREQAAHLIAISEAEKREGNLKKVLDIEKKCVFDLERALGDMREEHAKIKVTSETTMVDANARVEVLEKKRVEIEGKSHSAKAKLAEADRKISELDRKLQDLEVRESILQRERLTLTQEQEAHESYIRKRKEDLLEWEKKLQDAEQRHCDSRRLLNAREEKLHQTERNRKHKQRNFEELQKKIDLANATLKKMEDDVNNQLADLNTKEEKAEAMRSDLEMREKQLKEKEDLLDARERVELQKLLDEHKDKLASKMHEFELEMKQQRKSLGDELESRMEAVHQKETEIKHLVVKLGKREQALENKSERVKEKEKDVEAKVKALKDKEKFIKAEERKLEAERKQVKADKEGLENLKEQIEMLRNDMKNLEVQIKEEREKLKNVEEERSEYLRLQLNLKQEMENVRRQNQLIEKEAEDLKMEREKIEKDWEALDERRASVNHELKILDEEKASFAKLRNSEEERLKKEKAEMDEYIRRESEGLRLEKESFVVTREHEKLMLAQKAENEHSHMLQDFEQLRQKLENDMQKRQREWEKVMQEKEQAFEEKRSQERRNISHSKEVAEKKKEEMETERRCIEKERQEMELSKKNLEETSFEISKDIEALDNLSKKLKKQRERLINERAQFGACIEKIKSCKNCGDTAQAFLNRDLQLPLVEEGSSHLPRLSRHDGNNHKDELSPLDELSNRASGGVNKESSYLGGQMSVLRKCASIIFPLSPNKKIQSTDGHIMEESPQSHPGNENGGAGNVLLNSDEADVRARTSANDKPGPSYGRVNDSVKNSQSDLVREGNVGNSPSVDDSDMNRELQGIQETEKSDLRNDQRKLGKKRGPGVRRTHSVKAVVEDAKAVLGETLEGKMEQPNNPAHANANCQEKTVNADITLLTSASKRTRSQASKMTESEQDVDHSEGKADSVTTGGRRKRRQTVASALPTPGRRRYNLRNHTVAGTATAEQASSGKTKDEDEAAHEGTNRATLNPDDAPAQSLDIAIDSGRRLNMVHVSTAKSIEFSTDRIVRFNAPSIVDNNVDAAKSEEHTLLGEEAKSADNTLVSEEDNGISENVDEDHNGSMFNENEEKDPDNDGGDGVDDDDDDDDGDEGEDEDDYGHPGQASMGKKLWKFFTT